MKVLVKKYISFIKWLRIDFLPLDKQLHFSLFFIGAFILSLAGYLIVPILPLVQLIVLLLGNIIGGYKELVYDKIQGKGNPDWADIAVNNIGMAVAFLLLDIMLLIF